jgi:hypothetical protein
LRRVFGIRMGEGLRHGDDRITVTAINPADQAGPQFLRTRSSGSNVATDGESLN